MSDFQFRTRGQQSPQEKQRVYFTCHPDDFEKYFEDIKKEILDRQDCAVFFLEPSTEPESVEDYELRLREMQLFVVPVTTKLLKEANRAMDVEVPFAYENHIPVLPLMQERVLDEVFNAKFGDLQYLNKYDSDPTAIPYEEKLTKYLESVIVSDELAKKVRAAFDAYIFLSYRKKDRKYAQKLMRLIHNNPRCRDIAIWYDEFLTPGEDFNDAIRKALKNSKIFALSVTPNLLEMPEGKPNYVMDKEYPEMRKLNKPLIPAEMLPTEKEKLEEYFSGIPEPLKTEDENEFDDALDEIIHNLAITPNYTDPQHNFFIGLAYLDGIDVEVNHKLAIELLTYAANNGCEQAIDKLIDCYQTGSGAKRDLSAVMYWLKKKINLLESLNDKMEDRVLSLAKAYLFLGEMYSQSTDPEKKDKAEALLLNAISTLSRCDFTDPKIRYSALNTKIGANRLLAVWYEEHNDYDEAERLYKEVYAQWELQFRTVPDNLYLCMRMAQIMQDLGTLSAKKGDSDKACEYLRNAVNICKQFVDYDTRTQGFYAFAALQLSNFLERTEQYDEAIVYVEEAIKNYRAVCENNSVQYSFLLAQALTNKAIILSALHTSDSQAITALYEEAEAVYEADSANCQMLDLVSYMVCLYKHANLLDREGDTQACFAAYEKSIVLADKLLKSAAEADLMFQIAVIFLDYGSLLYEAEKEFRDYGKALILLKKACGLLCSLVEITGKWAEFLEETETKISFVKQLCRNGEDDSGNENADMMTLLSIASKMDQYTKIGESYEQAENYFEALKYYRAAMDSLDRLEELGEEMYPLARCDLLERIGSLFAECDKFSEAMTYYKEAYQLALTELKKHGNEKAYNTLQILLDRMGIAEPTAKGKAVFYGSMKQIAIILLKKEASPKNYDSLAYALYKCGIADKSRYNKSHLRNACDIWEHLTQTYPDNAEYREWLEIARQCLREAEKQ